MIAQHNSIDQDYTALLTYAEAIIRKYNAASTIFPTDLVAAAWLSLATGNHPYSKAKMSALVQKEFFEEWTWQNNRVPFSDKIFSGKTLASIGLRTCAKCGERKPTTEFYTWFLSAESNICRVGAECRQCIIARTCAYHKKKPLIKALSFIKTRGIHNFNSTAPCTKCKQQKPVTCFARCRSKILQQYYLAHHCNDCHKKVSRKDYYKENKERILDQQRQYRQAKKYSGMPLLANG